ncbi:hypothetical protein [Actinokineospora sp. UTMC 2448]|uniref:hypothetical protein n=1 Tax=Actinokineospora sp. UTMC 2448 TaxID=2268449 RepID=UPI0021642198|nr:hypothetical protein [Actinokineospora sp. UTMC 2448]UVS77814.1 hypothetical protein Actkin_01536 [Actinokineospora sp. UTMC 2448]
MSWTDYYRRRDALDAVLELARHDPEGPLPFPEQAAAEFADRGELLLALHYRWSVRLTGRVGLAQAEAEKDATIDPVEAVAQAWRATAAEHPVLRRVLDANTDTHGGVLRPAIEGEQRMLAIASGLAEHTEPAEEIARVGAAYLALIRSTPSRERHRGNRVEQFLRRLVASA